MNSQMIYTGRQLTSNADKLVKVSLDYVYHSLRNPKDKMLTCIRNLRIIKKIDVHKYSAIKKTLPYLVCGVFNPSFRRTENFAYTEYFMVDIDNISQKGVTLSSLRSDLQKDPRVVMMFLSPGEDGLKLLFRLSERCYDAGLYSLFYKMFVRKFSAQYHLEQVVDMRTSDVCRACFMSVDPNAYFNPDAESVSVGDFIDMDNPSMLFDAKREEDNKIKEEQKDVRKEMSSAYEDAEPDDDSIQKIKDILKLKSRPAKVNAVFVPEQLNDIVDELKKYIEETGIIVTEIVNINYAKKIRMKMGIKLAEVNVFYGKHGFNVVISPRSGTDKNFNEVSSQLIESYFSLHYTE